MCSHGCTCVHMLLLTCKHIRESVMHNDYTRTGDTSKQGWSKDVKAWDDANIVAPVLTTSDVRCDAGGLYVGASNWQDAPTGPPKTIIGTFVERTKTAFVNLPIPVNNGCLSSDAGGTDWKIRHARHYN